MLCKPCTRPNYQFTPLVLIWQFLLYTNIYSSIFSSFPAFHKVLCNIDELFDREEFSAAPDSGWPDCFNSGVFVFQPSLKTYNLLLQFAAEHGSFDGKVQGVRNVMLDSFHAIRHNRGRQEFSGLCVGNQGAEFCLLDSCI